MIFYFSNEFYFSGVYRSVNYNGLCAKRTDPEGAHVYFASDQSIYISINITKIKFVASVYIRFNHTFDEKSYISPKTEAVNILHAVCLLTAEQRRRPIRL